MLAEIVSVGDELLTGMVVNNNAAFIGEKLTQLGYEVRWISVVGDNEADLIEALERAYDRAFVVVTTGGLGPTHDDITKNVVAKFFDSEIVFRSDIFERIETFFRNRGLNMAPINRIQAEVPDKAEIIENKIGTAPGFIFSREDRSFFILPGVPSEMKKMMERTVIPRLRNQENGPVFRSKVLRTTGITESELYQKIQDFLKQFPEVKLAFLPNPSGVAIRLVVSEASAEICEKQIALAEAFIRDKVEMSIYGEGDISIERALANLLFEKKLTIAAAESCTGGLVSHKLTNVSGSSTYFYRGIVAYSNEAKVKILEVPEEIIRMHGAVSSETAVAMAEGVRKISGTDIGVSTTGIAGPTGGTTEKPVGLVYIGYADKKRSMIEKHRFVRDRRRNKERSAVAALNLVRKVILGYV